MGGVTGEESRTGPRAGPRGERPRAALPRDAGGEGPCRALSTSGGGHPRSGAGLCNASGGSAGALPTRWWAGSEARRMGSELARKLVAGPERTPAGEPSDPPRGAWRGRSAARAAAEGWCEPPAHRVHPLQSMAASSVTFNAPRASNKLPGQSARLRARRARPWSCRNLRCAGAPGGNRRFAGAHGRPEWGRRAFDSAH
jgi:hypothetical protein